MAKGLTPRQEEILRFIRTYVSENGYPPSIREIGKQFNIGSLRGVTVHLDALARKGQIERQQTPRSIKVTAPNPAAALADAFAMVRLPMLGTIAAGEPIFADTHVEDHVSLPADMVKNPDTSFVLRVQGDSMIGDGIHDHDLVIIQQQSTAAQNELIAARINDEATVKRFHRNRDGSILLMPSNPAYEPIPFNPEEGAIVGRVIGLLRRY